MLYALLKSKCKKRKGILKTCDNSLIQVISEIVQNILNGNIRLNEKQRNFLKKYKRELRLIKRYNTKSKSIGLKRKILVQRGGFIQAIIGALLSSAIGALIDKFTH